MYIYRLQHLRELDKSIRRRPNNTFVLFFERTLTFDSAMCPTFFPEFIWYVQKPVAANGKAATINTVLFSHMSD